MFSISKIEIERVCNRLYFNVSVPAPNEEIVAQSTELRV